MAKGYTGKILKVDLNNHTFSVVEKGENFYRTFMGGSAMASFFLLTEIEKGIDALSPENAIVVTTSVLSGARLAGANRHTVAAKSPLNDGFGEAESGGYFSNELKRAGFDAVMIKGRSPKPVYLWIKDGKIEIRDAAHIWGRDTGFAHDTILAENHDNKIRTLLIGQGGENLVRYAAVIHDLQHANGRSGMGAVFGSKNLKGIAVRGNGELEFHNPQGLKELQSYFVKNMGDHPVCAILTKGGTWEWDLEDLNADGVLPTKNFKGGAYEHVEKINYEAYKKSVYSKRLTCFACPLNCKQVAAGGKFDVDPRFAGPQYETVGAFGSVMLIEDVEVIAKAHELCNRYSLDTIETGMTIAFAMECAENGILTKKDTDGIDLVFGNGDAVLRMIERIAFRRGFGDLLAEGSWRAAKKIGQGSEKYVMTVKKQSFAMHEPRGKYNIGLAYALSPTGADHIEAAHDMNFEEGRWAIPDLYCVGILTGVPARGFSPKKVSWFVYNQHIYSFLNSLGLCFFTAGPARLFRLNQVVDMIHYATGWETSLFEIMLLGERTTTLARLFLAREGLGREDDMLPDRLFEPLESGSLTGEKLDKKKFIEALDYYYEMMGWDVKTGVPREAKLHHLNIADLSQF